MPKKKLRGEGYDYEEVKVRVNISLTPSAKRLLKEKAKGLGYKSLSDYIENIART